jgi:hypothetical protein
MRGVQHYRRAARLAMSTEAQLHEITTVPDLDHILDLGAKVLEPAVNRLVPVADALVTAKPIR